VSNCGEEREIQCGASCCRCGGRCAKSHRMPTRSEAELDRRVGCQPAVLAVPPTALRWRVRSERRGEGDHFGVREVDVWRRCAMARATPTRGGGGANASDGANGESRGPGVWSDWPGGLQRGGKLVAGKVAATVSARRRAGRKFATMAKIESKHDVRRRVREAQAQANRERLKRESDNREDMVAFLVAQQKLTAVDEWESDRHELVQLEADQRREEQRLDGARALARMRKRGESVASIAQIGGCSEKLVRSYLKELRMSMPGSGAESGSGSQALDLDNGASDGDGSEALGGPEPDDLEAREASPTVGVGVGE
jgi:hypothetical protein